MPKATDTPTPSRRAVVGANTIGLLAGPDAVAAPHDAEPEILAIYSALTPNQQGALFDLLKATLKFQTAMREG